MIRMEETKVLEWGGVEQPFLEKPQLHYRSFGPEESTGVVPLQRKDAVEYELCGFLKATRIICCCCRSWRWDTDCPMCIVATLGTIETAIGLFGILYGCGNWAVECERKLQLLIIAFGALQLIQTVSMVSMVCKCKNWKSYETWFAPGLIVSGFGRFVGLICGCALVFGKKGKCDPDLQVAAKWYVAAHVALMASSFCYLTLLIHPSYAIKWPKKKRRRPVLEIGRHDSQETVQMVPLRTDPTKPP
mmetsp:Transcript_30800/g.75108  ORF Transcript_30800/g.75108 Transcript_30800/m.75108 type:complete len:246 (-) Transcript_30800:383-1120(-)